MDKILAITNVVVGLLACSLQVYIKLNPLMTMTFQLNCVYTIFQISELLIYNYWDWGPDMPGAGIWGGIYLVIFGLLLIVKK